MGSRFTLVSFLLADAHLVQLVKDTCSKTCHYQALDSWPCLLCPPNCQHHMAARGHEVCAQPEGWVSSGHKPLRASMQEGPGSRPGRPQLTSVIRRGLPFSKAPFTEHMWETSDFTPVLSHDTCPSQELIQFGEVPFPILPLSHFW